MAATPTPRNAEPPVVAVAVSGGGDSTALLHATVHAARALGLSVVALHVHHGLQPQADAWLHGLRERCRRWAARGLPVRFAATRLAGRPGPGDSVEAWARRERYAALAAMARAAGATLVLLAHHRRDQAETFLLQALRGGAPAGLAAMPAQVQRAGLSWARPWLDHDAAAIAAYLRRHRLRAACDPSNADPAHARSRLRLQVMPALRAAFDGAEAALAAAAREAQAAQACLDEVAAADLAAACDADGALRLRDWRALTPARARNALRAWLRAALGRGAPGSAIERVLAEAGASPVGAWPLPGAELRLYRGRLRVLPLAPAAVAGGLAVAIDITGPGTYALPAWGARLQVEPAADGGLAPDRLRHCALRARSGGERFQAAPGGVARSLKKQFQAAGVPAWQRHAPLLVDRDGCLLWVPGLGVDARARAPAGAAQWRLAWLPGDRAQACAPGP
jgi:tRNA(Ile)-lysidine synthase